MDQILIADNLRYIGDECVSVGEWNVERWEIDIQGQSVLVHVWSEVKFIYSVSLYLFMFGAK